MLIALLSGCATNMKLTALEEMKPLEAIVVAKVTLIYNDEDVTDRVGFIFDGRRTGAHIPVLPESKYLFLKMLPGKHTLDSFQLRAGLGMKAFAANEVSFEVLPNQVNYIGDLYVVRNGMGWLGTLLSVDPVLSNLLMHQGEHTVAVTANLDAAQAAFSKRFNTDRKLTESLIKLAPPAAE